MRGRRDGRGLQNYSIGYFTSGIYPVVANAETTTSWIHTRSNNNPGEARGVGEAEAGGEK